MASTWENFGDDIVNLSFLTLLRDFFAKLLDQLNLLSLSSENVENI